MIINQPSQIGSPNGCTSPIGGCSNESILETESWRIRTPRKSRAIDATMYAIDTAR